MSGAYDEYLERSDRGLSSIPDKSVCSSHIDDDAIRLYINRTGDKGICNYCGKKRKVLELEKLMFYITDGFRQFYTDPANFMTYITAEGGYQGNVYSPTELLDEQIGLNIKDNKLYNDIHNSFDQTTAWSNEYEYYDSEADYRMQDWDEFKKIVMSQSRYMFSTEHFITIDSKRQDVFSTLKSIGRIAKQLKMVKDLPAGTVLYRCRQHKSQDDVTKFEDITSPPDDKAIYPNRMSPSGISMFYSAFDYETSYLETIDLKSTDKYYSTARFTNKRQMKILDLSFKIMPSIFEQREWNNYYTISFLNSFIKDFSKSVKKDGMVHIEYVPTQIVTEYFRYMFKIGNMQLDGIIYPSSKNNGKKACLLFLNQNDSMSELDFDISSLKTYKLL